MIVIYRLRYENKGMHYFMKKTKRVLIILFSLFISLFLINCNFYTPIKEDDYKNALDFSANDYFQIKFELKNSDRSLNYNLKVYNDIIYLEEYGNGLKNNSTEYYFSFKSGKFLGVFSLPGKDFYAKSDSLEEVFSIPGIGKLEYYSFYSTNEMLQLLLWDLLYSEMFTFLSEKSLKDMIGKMNQNENFRSSDLDELYQVACEGSIFYKEYEELEYDKQKKCYIYYEDPICLRYFFENKKISKIEWESSDNGYQFTFEFSYDIEKLDLPKYYNLYNNEYQHFIETDYGTINDLKKDFEVYNIIYSNGKFVLSDENFGSLENNSSLLVVNNFTESDYAYVFFIDEIKNDICYICYVIKTNDTE